MKPKKMRRRKQERIRAWEQMITRGSSEYKVQQRMQSGGYRCPGSNKRT